MSTTSISTAASAPKSELSTAPNLEYFRKHAKALLKQVTASDPLTVQRVQVHLTKFVVGSPFLLSDAQWIIAREQGFESWPKFKAHLDSLAGEISIVGSDAPVEAKLSSNTALPMGDEAVMSKTGKPWEEWFTILDARGAVKMSHKEIVAILHNEYGIGSWWQQMLTVGYEQARGLRVKNQSCAGYYQVSINKTINAPLAALFDAWANEDIREQWLPGAKLTIRKANPGKNLRITWLEGGNVEVNLYAKGDFKTQCSVQHDKFTDQELIEPLRAYWAAALERLKAMLEV